MSLGLNGSSAGASASGWKEIARYDTAGTYTWTCPKTATYGVFVAGGGGSGCAIVILGSGYYNGTGAASGYSNYGVVQKSVGQTVSIKVGAGGASVTQARSKGGTPGNSGGDSSFANLTANGGAGGKPYTTSVTYAKGAAWGIGGSGKYGPYVTGINVETKNYELMGLPWTRVNPFTAEPCLGAGGGGKLNASSSPAEIIPYSGGKNSFSGLGGGDAGNNVGESATEFGCGGGAGIGNNTTATSGAGADGIVIIYEKLE